MSGIAKSIELDFSQFLAAIKSNPESHIIAKDIPEDEHMASKGLVSGSGSVRREAKKTILSRQIKLQLGEAARSETLKGSPAVAPRYQTPTPEFIVQRCSSLGELITQSCKYGRYLRYCLVQLNPSHPGLKLLSMSSERSQAKTFMFVRLVFRPACSHSMASPHLACVIAFILGGSRLKNALQYSILCNQQTGKTSFRFSYLQCLSNL